MHSIINPNTAGNIAAPKKANKRLNQKDREILNHLSAIQNDLKISHKSFDYTTDPTLIDSIVYEIMSLNMKYKYFLTLCKERGLTIHMK